MVILRRVLCGIFWAVLLPWRMLVTLLITAIGIIAAAVFVLVATHAWACRGKRYDLKDLSSFGKDLGKLCIDYLIKGGPLLND